MVERDSSRWMRRAWGGLVCLTLALPTACAPEPPPVGALVGELRERSLALAERSPGAASLEYFRQMNEALRSVHDRESAIEHLWQVIIVADRMGSFMVATDDPSNRMLPSPDSLARATRDFEGHLARLEGEEQALIQLREPFFEIVMKLREGQAGA